MMEFKVGDVVEWCGIKGKVDSIGNYMKVHFYVDGIADNLIDWGPQYTFNKDGKQFDWHIEPSLKLIERPNQKVKKYQVLYKDHVTNTFVLSNALFESEQDYYRSGRSRTNTSFIKLVDETMIEVEE